MTATRTRVAGGSRQKLADDGIGDVRVASKESCRMPQD
jgi:hypothetical protein